MSGNPAEFQLPGYSDSYAVLNAQISRNFNKKIRAYVGEKTLLHITRKMQLSILEILLEIILMAEWYMLPS